MSPTDAQKIAFGGAKRGAGPHSRAGVRPRHAATYPEILAAIATAHLTTAEARTIGLRAIQRANDIRRPLDHESPQFYREADERDDPLEEPVCRSTDTLVE